MKQIRLENFRCYTNQIINFRPGINLLIGDNGSGKTTILKALKYVLSAFFSGFSDENTKWISPEAEDFASQIKDGLILPEKPVKVHFICHSQIYPSLPYKGSSVNPGRDNQIYTLQKNSKKNSRALVTGIAGYRDYCRLLGEEFFSEKLNRQIYALPLFACFSTEDIHSTRKIDTGKFIKYAQKASFGYYECLDGNGFLPYWLKRLLVLQEGQKNLEEIEIVRQALIRSLGPKGCNILSDMQIRPNQKKVYFIFSDGREVEAGLLSDGYKRLINIVIDIAFRCALLNRNLYGKESCEQTRGIVLIDEIDLHLHPTLQACILRSLKHAFPNLQFIVTTHAPMIMTSVENNEQNIVFKLNYSLKTGYTMVETHTYGMDVATITHVVLDQIPRDTQVDKELKYLFEMIDNNQIQEAWLLLNSLQERFGNNLPELSEAEAMLNFTIEDDEVDSKE
ncbi:AAA family ATPase [Parabacteroides pacaensis]|uniref:AAA family ATPase n=1 Tax=Parabacteroides pacaensis TaxID=2086575 RepID=UPI000D0EE0FD|nr:AAA family ATPase [Parabacteroides pacaensis]